MKADKEANRRARMAADPAYREARLQQSRASRKRRAQANREMERQVDAYLLAMCRESAGLAQLQEDP